jgi:hypothetical protein
MKPVLALSAVWLLLLLPQLAIAQEAPKGPILLKGAPMGAVKFDHPAHLAVAAKCVVCHHASKPAKPLKHAQESCSDCHTTPATAPVTTKRQAAFHNATATAGLCIGCHKTENASGKGAPVKCVDCHKNENG